MQPAVATMKSTADPSAAPELQLQEGTQQSTASKATATSQSPKYTTAYQRSNPDVSSLTLQEYLLQPAIKDPWTPLRVSVADEPEFKETKGT